MKTRNIVILLVLLAISFYIGFKSNKVEIVKTKTETITKYDTITKTIDNTKPTKIEKVYIKVPNVIHDTINLTKIDTVFSDKKVNKYTYVDTVKNGRLESVILADTIYKRSVKLTTFNENTNETITNYVIPNNVMMGVDTNINAGIQQTSLNFYFIKGDKWLFKGGFGYDFNQKTHFYSVGLAFKF